MLSQLSVRVSGVAALVTNKKRTGATFLGSQADYSVGACEPEDVNLENTQSLQIYVVWTCRISTITPSEDNVTQ